MTNTIATIVTSTTSINRHNKKVKDCYTLYKVLFVIILLLMITVICYHYAKQRFIYYFDHIIKLEDFDLDNILIDEKSHENILLYEISYKTLIDPKPLSIRFDKINGFIKICDGTKYLTLFRSENYDDIYDRIRYLISLKSGMTHIFCHYFAKIRVDSYDSLPIEKTLNQF